jgi:hypothetical protein
MGPQQNFGVPSIPGPMVWGMGPWMPSLGMNSQQSLGWYTSPVMGMNPQQNVGFASPWIGMPQQQGGQPAQQAAAQPVQCSINTVAALTKSVDDCEKAGGDVPGSKTADAAKK